MTKDDIAKHIFARNPKVAKLFFTSDGTPFYEKHSAEAHAQRLKDRGVSVKNRIVSEAIEEAKKNIAAKNAQKLEPVKEPAKEPANETGSEPTGEGSKEGTGEAGAGEGNQEKAKDAPAVDVSFLEGNLKKSSATIKTLSLEQLDAVEAAEKAKEEPRKGIFEAVASRRAELTNV